MSENEATKGRTFTEGEAYALVNDNVARETAALNDKITGLESEKSELQTKIDVLETEKAQEKTRADEAVQELTDYKASVEAEKAAEARLVERKAQVAEANPLLDLESEEAGKARLTRIAAMSDEDFTAYLADMREVASKSTAKADDAKPTEGAGGPPRATAAFSTDSGEKPTGTVMALFGARHGASA